MSHRDRPKAAAQSALKGSRSATRAAVRRGAGESATAGPPTRPRPTRAATVRRCERPSRPSPPPRLGAPKPRRRSAAAPCAARATRRSPRQAAALVAGIKDGSIRNRSGDPYKPSVIRDYERSLRLYIRPELGAKKLSGLYAGRRAGLRRSPARHRQLDPSSVKNILMPLRVIYRRAFARSEVAINPTTGLELPASPRAPPADRRPGRGGGADRGAAARGTGALGVGPLLRACGAGSCGRCAGKTSTSMPG